MHDLKKKYEALLISIKANVPVKLEDKFIKNYVERAFDKLSSIFQIEEQSALLTQLTAFLEENAMYVTHTAPCFSYTTLSRHAFTLFLCDISEAIAEELNLHLKEEEKIHPLRLLMPKVVCTAPANMPLKNILNTHILSGDGLRLLSVNLLIAVELDDACGLSIPQEMQINAEEWHRLQQHSMWTQAIVSAKARYDQVREQSNRLLTYFSALLIDLEEFNDQERNKVIIAFKQQYESFELDQKKIPKPIRDCLQQLFECIFSDSDDEAQRVEKSSKARFTLRYNLQCYIFQYGHDLFYNLVVSKQYVIEEHNRAFQLAKQEFESALETSAYHGSDKTQYSHSMLEQGLTSTIQFRTDDLIAIQRLQPDDIEMVFNQPKAKEAFLQRLKDMEGLRQFLLNCTPLQARKILVILRKELFSYQFNVKLCHSTRQETNGRWLQTLRSDFFQLFCDVLAYDNWSWRPYICFVQYMDYQHTTMVLETHKEKILQISFSAESLANSLVCDLNYESAKAFIDFLMKYKRLQSLLCEGKRDVSTEYYYLTKALGRDKLELVVRAVLMLGLFPNIVSCSGAWINLCFSHPPSMRVAILNQIASDLSFHIPDLCILGSYLNGHSANYPTTPEERKIICRAVKVRFAKISESPRQWTILFRELDEGDYADIGIRLRASYPKLEADDIRHVVNHSSDLKDQAKRKAVYEAITGNTTSEIVDGHFLDRLVMEENRSRQIQALYKELEAADIKLSGHDQACISGFKNLDEVSRAIELLKNSRLLNQKCWDYIKTRPCFSAAIHGLSILRLEQKKDFCLTGRQLFVVITCSQEDVFDYQIRENEFQTRVWWSYDKSMIYIQTEAKWLLENAIQQQPPGFFPPCPNQALQLRNQLALMNVCIEMHACLILYKRELPRKHQQSTPFAEKTFDFLLSDTRVLTQSIESLENGLFQRDPQKVIDFIEKEESLKEVEGIVDTTRRMVSAANAQEHKEKSQLLPRLHSLEKMGVNFQQIVIRMRTERRARESCFV